jgi:hypothetical protein
MNFTKDFIQNMANSAISNFISYFSAIQIYTSAEDGVYYFVDRFISGETRHYGIGLKQLEEKLIQHVSISYNVQTKEKV